ncbi:MAG: UDP-galactopyranose mutase [Nitrospirae bacterium]|nr:UDP-galactopyranose mutase [Nitrospirota bacterium]
MAISNHLATVVKHGSKAIGFSIGHSVDVLRGRYDVVIVGAGISGAVLAERFASVCNKKVLVLEKRPHVGGICYDFIDKHGILVPLYGPHMFHTSYENVWRYLSAFTGWLPYEHKVKSCVDGKLVPVPVNISTVNDIFGLHIQTEEEMVRWLDENTVKIADPQNSEEQALSRVGPILYEKMFRHYTRKQWDRWPNELDASLLKRIPVRTNFDDRYFSDTHEGVPANGYTRIFENMLGHKNITVLTNVDFHYVKKELRNYEVLIYTGPIDAFFDYRHGKLQYRSLRFEFETYNRQYYQEHTVINYPDDEVLYARVTEPKHQTGQKHHLTTIIREYFTWDGPPYYPVPSPQNRAVYEKYRDDSAELQARGVYFTGRLAGYKHLNMDQAFKEALDLFHGITAAG